MSDISAMQLHTRIGICMLGAPTSTSCIHCVTVGNVRIQSPRTHIANSACKVVPAMSRQDTARLAERAYYFGSVLCAVHVLKP